MDIDRELESINESLNSLKKQKIFLQNEKIKKVAKNKELIEKYCNNLIKIWKEEEYEGMEEIPSFDEYIKYINKDFYLNLSKHLTMVPVEFFCKDAAIDDGIFRTRVIYYEWDNKPICFMSNNFINISFVDSNSLKQLKHLFVKDNILEKFQNKEETILLNLVMDNFEYKELWKTDESFNTLEAEKLLTLKSPLSHPTKEILKLLDNCPEEFLLIWFLRIFDEYYEDKTLIYIEDILDPSRHSDSVYKEYF